MTYLPNAGKAIDAVKTTGALPLAYYENFLRMPLGAGHNFSSLSGLIGWGTSTFLSGRADNTHLVDAITTGLPAGYTQAITFAGLNNTTNTVTGITLDTQQIFGIDPDAIPANCSLVLTMRATGLTAGSHVQVLDGFTSTTLHDQTTDLTTFTQVTVPLTNSAGRIWFAIYIYHLHTDPNMTVDFLDMTILAPGQTARMKDNSLKVVLEPQPELYAFSYAENNWWQPVSQDYIDESVLEYYVDEGDTANKIAVTTSGQNLFIDPPADNSHFYNAYGNDVILLDTRAYGVVLVGLGDYEVTGEAHVEGLTAGDVVELEWHGVYAGDWYPKAQFVCPPGQTDVRCRFDTVVQNPSSWASAPGVNPGNGFIARVYFTGSAGTRAITQYGVTVRKLTGIPAKESFLDLTAPTLTTATSTTAGQVDVNFNIDQLGVAYYIHLASTDHSFRDIVQYAGSLGANSTSVFGLPSGKSLRVVVYKRNMNTGHFSPVSNAITVTVA